MEGSGGLSKPPCGTVDRSVVDPDHSNSQRFVVLEHLPGDAFSRTPSTHFDWMFEYGDVLVTFATEVIDFANPPNQLMATKIADHRIKYLQYEGALSGDRGSVARVALGSYKNLGSYKILKNKDLVKRYCLEFSEFRSRNITFSHVEGDQWVWTIHEHGSGSNQP